jgi:hypothetical protein
VGSQLRKTQKQENAEAGSKQIFGVDFHDFIQKEEAHTNIEPAEEFSISLKHVRDLKHKMNRL